uniref:RNase H domain-containing protein n=1 Tax=Heligmosomoides polygyrus TaxID=6339 RepID=A0A8L8JYQ0_HELPZ
LSRTDKYFIKKEKITIAQQGLFSREVSPDIIIGQDLLNKVIDHETSVIKLPSGLILTPTIFGYTISGASDETAILAKNSTSECSSLIIATPSLTAKDDYKENIKHLYELESLGINTDRNTDEASIVKFMDSYRKTITIESGRITAGFPFTDEVRNLKDNFNVAIRRLQNLLRTLQGDKEKFNLYNDTLTSYLQDGLQTCVLSQINGYCFDPLGLLTPLLIPAKIFLQDLHKKKYGWDVPLSEEDEAAWKTIHSAINGFEISLHRRVIEKNYSTKHTLSIFIALKELTPAAATSQRYHAEIGRIHDCSRQNHVTTTSCGNRKDSRLFTAKSKIAPISKEQTIPRLELLSIFIGLSLAESTIQRIDTKFEQINIFSDSTIALCWVHGNRRLPSIVSNLVQKMGAIAKRLRESTQVVFFHVPTNENVADCATRELYRTDYEFRTESETIEQVDGAKFEWDSTMIDLKKPENDRYVDNNNHFLYIRAQQDYEGAYWCSTTDRQGLPAAELFSLQHTYGKYTQEKISKESLGYTTGVAHGFVLSLNSMSVLDGFMMLMKHVPSGS